MNPGFSANYGNRSKCSAKKDSQEMGFEFLRGEYAKMPRRAPRKKVKMKFDANGIPKVIKTTHAAEDLALIAYIKMTEIGPKVPKSRSKTP
jgi:hypothetical protein